MRIAVKYDIQNLIDELPIDNKKNYGLAMDSEYEQEIVDFIKQNEKKFILMLNVFLSRSRNKDLIADAPHCSKEFRWKKCGNFNGGKKLNSRIYFIEREGYIILCHIDKHKTTKQTHKSIASKIENICKSEYTFKNKDQTLIKI